MQRNCLYALLLPLLVTVVLIPGVFATECLPPPSEDPCEPRSPGYWKNHPEAWPVDAIQIGSTLYSKEDAIALMMTPVQGDHSLTHFKAEVATLLNEEAGCLDPCPVDPDPCPPPPECDPCEPRSPGYWKNHPEAWPVETITIGAITYTKVEAIAWMNTSVRGDKSITLFKAYVAVFLNQAAGCDVPCELVECLDSALTRLTNHPVGSDWRANTPSWQECGEPLYDCLEASYNGA